MVDKKLIEISNGNKAEAVYFEDDRKQCICFSTQLNCAVGCGFCASTQPGTSTINLSVKDMLKQVFKMETWNTDKVMLYSIMGEGEPFLNYKNVIRTMKLLQNRENCKIAVSTTGYKLPNFGLERFEVPVKLQVSVHAGNEHVRKQLVPNGPGIAEIREGLRYYHKRNPDGEVDLNFTLVPGVNDSWYDMFLIKGLFPDEHIKLSKLNGAKGTANAENCLKILQDYGMSAEYQESPGSEIAASCGMTRGESKVDAYDKKAVKLALDIDRMSKEARNSTLRFGTWF